MDKIDDLSEKLLKENGLPTEGSVDHLIEELHRTIQKEKSRLRQMKWVTLGLWLATVCFAYPTILSSRRNVDPSSAMEPLRLFLNIVAHWLPAMASVSTVVLLVRYFSFSRRETNLRLRLIEAQLQRRGTGERQ